jgi:hypothetical protein
MIFRAVFSLTLFVTVTILALNSKAPADAGQKFKPGAWPTQTSFPQTRFSDDSQFFIEAE